MQIEAKDQKKEDLVKEMFQLGAHFGYSRSSRHASIKPYIFTFKNKVAIIDLEKTAKLLDDACEFVKELGKNRKTIIFVGTKNEARNIIKDVADSVDMPYVAERWIGGTMTNFKEVRKRIERMQDLSDKKIKGELNVYTKKERGKIDKELKDLERYFLGINSLNKLPGALFIVDAKREDIAKAEAVKLKIPVISLCNSDCNILGVDYPIVANDSQKASIKFFSQKIAEAYKEGLKEAPTVEVKEATKTKEVK